MLTMPRLKIQRLDPGIELPVRASDGAAGLDLCSTDNVTIFEGQQVSIGTGIAVEIPRHCVGLVRGRSGLAFRNALWVFEGTIDADFRGEIRVLARGFPSLSEWPVQIYRGARIAQLVIVPAPALVIEEVASLSETARGSGGFGSTGV